MFHIFATTNLGSIGCGFSPVEAEVFSASAKKRQFSVQRLEMRYFVNLSEFCTTCLSVYCPYDAGNAELEKGGTFIKIFV